MRISRREFLRYCGVSAAALGLSTVELGGLERALANLGAPTVIWLQGAACTGCSVSFLNRISNQEPLTAADVLIDSINLTYHPNLMAAAGESAVAAVEDAYNAGGYLLAVEGGVPTAFGGATCWAWSTGGADTTFVDAVTALAARASKILSIGTCACWGGVPAAPPNPTGVKGVGAATGMPTINIAGCPPHPDWITWVIVQLLLGKTVAVDSYGRPTQFFSRTVHDQCPRRETEETETFGVDRRCLKELGCQGPVTRANCPIQLWNGGTNWCIDANARCLRCTEPSFPGTQLFTGEEGGDESDD
jgi:NiFe hydrogenase small subunit HydA